MFKLEPNKSYKQFTKMTTTSEYDFGSEDFVESLHMMIDGKLDVEEWVEHGKHEGYSIGITFDQVAVETEDSSGDSTYYNSLAENGDSDFDEVLETMVGEKVYVEVNDEYDLVDEEDSENTLEELEQEYSYGTTTGLSAIDQVIQLTNLMSFLPSDPSKDYFPGDSWEFSMETDIYFEGRSTFEGYLNYNGIECAVINSVAKIDDDKENTIGDDGWDIEEIEIENGTIEATFYWDVKNNIPRFALTKIVMTTEVQSVIDEDGEGSTSLDETDDNNIELPMTEVLEMYVAPV